MWTAESTHNRQAHSQGFERVGSRRSEYRGDETQEAAGTTEKPPARWHLVKLIGVMELLEMYVSTSLIAQSAQSFPSQVWTQILETQKQLKKMEDKWIWSEEDLKLGSLEAPRKIIDRLVNEGIFRPKIRRTDVRSYRALEEANLIEDGQKIDDLFLDGEAINPLAGETVMQPISREEVEEVEAELELLAGSLVDTWEARQEQPALDR